MRFLLFLIPLFLIACQSDKKENAQPADLWSELEIIHRAVPNNGVYNNRDTALLFMDRAIAFKETGEERDSLPFIFYKAAYVGLNFDQFDKSMDLLQTVWQRYPEYSKAPDALYLQAFIYDEHLKNKDKAKEHYLLFKEKYPDNEFNKDVDQLLMLIDKDPEEIIESFEQKNAQ